VATLSEVRRLKTSSTLKEQCYIGKAGGEDCYSSSDSATSCHTTKANCKTFSGHLGKLLALHYNWHNCESVLTFRTIRITPGSCLDAAMQILN
jgi:hypothetical protein